MKVNRTGTRAAEYVQRIHQVPIQTTTDPKLALLGEIHGRRHGQIHPNFPEHPGISGCRLGPGNLGMARYLL